MASAAGKLAKVSRWGNSLGLRIPSEAVEQLNLKSGGSVRVRVKNGTMTVRPAKARRRYTEEELLKGVTPRACGPDLLPGRAGKEII